MAYSIPKRQIINYPPSALDGFHIYTFEWIDNLHFALPPSRFIWRTKQYIEKARQRFIEAGWAGDGQIKLLWLPPFVFPSEKSVAPTGVIVWHVKQKEDGISFLLSPVELPFDDFGESA